MCDVDDLVIVSMDARRVELDCAGPPHWCGSPPFSGANAGSAHSARRAVSVSLSLSHCRILNGISYRENVLNGTKGAKKLFCTVKTF